MINSLSIKEGHRKNLVKVDDIDILSISRSTDDIFIRCIEATKFYSSEYSVMIEFYSVSIDGNKFIYSPLFSNEPITYKEFKSSVAHLIFSGMVKKLAGVGITSKSLDFINLSNGTLLGISQSKFIRDNHNRFYYGRDCKSLLDLVLAFDFYILYIRQFRESKITESVRVFFNYCLDKIDSVYSGIRIEWADTRIENGEMKWAFTASFGGFIKRFRFYVEQFGDKLIAKTENGKYKEAYESLDEFIGILTDYIDERKKLDGIYPQKFITVLDVVRNYVGDRNINDIELSYDAENKEYSSLLLLNKYSINIYSNTSNKIYVECSYNNRTLSKGIAKNKSLENIRSQAMAFIEDVTDKI